MGMKREAGFSLIETLVVVGIIVAMFAIALPHYSKAIRLAKNVAANEAKRQDRLEAYKAYDCGDGNDGAAERHCARQAYRHSIDAGKFSIVVTELIYHVDNDGAFRAYWNTLINPAEPVPVQWDQWGNLIAVDPEGNSFTLKRNPQQIVPGDAANHPLAWDFLSTSMAEMSSGDIGTTVLMTDGSLKKMKYPGDFPCTAVVARLSHRFMEEVYPGLQ